MIETLNKIRVSKKDTKQELIIQLSMVIILGIVLGIVSKVLDSLPANEYPLLLETLDLGNFFSRIGVWIFIALSISVYSNNPITAAVSVLLFFIGMVSSYYLYTIVVLGFTPLSEIKIWATLTLVSPFLAIFCFYAKGDHVVSMILSIIIIMVTSRLSFAFGILYFDIVYILELILWVLTVLILYVNPKQITIVSITGVILFMLTAHIPIINGIL